MTQNINLNIVGTANFSPVYKEIGKLKVAMTDLQNTQIGKGFNTQLNSQLKGYEQDFLRAINSTKSFNVEQVKLADATDHLTTKLAKGQFSLGEYYSMFKRSRTGVVQELEQIAQAQAKVAKSMVIPSQRGGYAQVITDMSGVADKMKTAEIYQKALNTAMMDGATKLINFGKNTQWAGRQLTVGFAVPLMAAGGALANMFYQLDQNLRKMQSVYGIGGKAGGAFSSILPSQQEIANIRTQVIQLSQEMARTYGQTAQETAGVAADLAAAGYTGNQLLGLTKTVTKAMVLGESDRQTAMKATIALQSAYKLSTSQTADALNFFSAAQAATSTTMKDLIDAIPRVGPVVKNLGGSYKDTVAMLVAMKEGGVAAGEGANALKNSLGRLISPTKASVESLKVLGVDIMGIVQKNSGNVVGIIEALQQSLSKLSPLARQQAITDLFGKYQMARMTALLDNFNKSGTQSAKVMQMMSLNSQQLSNIADNQTKKLQESTSGQFKIAIETLKADLMPIGEEFLKIATTVVKAVDFIVKSFNNLGPIKYVLGGILGGTAVLGPIIMFTGLMANLVGQVFKLVSLFKMFRSGFSEAGGLSSPIKALTGAFAGLSNYFEEVDKAMVASQALSENLTATMVKQEDSLNILTAALTRYTNAIERASTINQVTNGGIIPPPPGGGPASPGGMPLLPTGGPRSPQGIIGEATRPTLPVAVPINAEKSSEGGRTGFTYTTTGGEKVKGTEFIHLVPDKQTQDILGKLAVVPGYFDLPNSPGVALNRNLKENPMPIIPPAYMTTEIVKQVLQDLKLSNQPWSIQAHAPAMSLENMASVESSKIAMLRAAQQMGPSVIPQLTELHKTGASGEDIHNFFNQALGTENWQAMRKQALQDVLAAYESAQTSVHEQFAANGQTGRIGTTAGFQAVTAKFGASLLSEYQSIISNMDQALVESLTVESNKVGTRLSSAVREGMRRNSVPAMINLAATASSNSDLVVEEFMKLIQVSQQASAKIAAQVASSAIQVAAIAGTETIPTVNEAAARVSRVTQITRGGLTSVKLATGGKIQGPGTATSDSIPAMLSDGEYVVNANAVGHYGTGFLDAVNSKKLAGGGAAGSVLSGMMDALFAREKNYSSSQIEKYLTSSRSAYTGHNIEDFFSSRRNAQNIDMKHIEELISSHKAIGTLEEQQLIKALEEHASGAFGDKKGLRALDPRVVDVGRASLDSRLKSIPGETVRLYRVIASTPETGRTAPGHYGYLPAGRPIEETQPYVSYSSDIEKAIRFAGNTQIANARVIEVDVPKSAIVGIQGANYTGTGNEGEFIVRSSELTGGARYVTFTGLSSVRKKSTDPLLKFIAEPGAESKGMLLSDIARRYNQKPSPEASRRVPGYFESVQAYEKNPSRDKYFNRYTPEEAQRFFGVTSEEVEIAKRHLEDKYSMPIKELAKNKNRKLFGKNYEDLSLLRLVSSNNNFVTSESPGLMSTIWSPNYINRAKGGSAGFHHHRFYQYHPRKFKYVDGGPVFAHTVRPIPNPSGIGNSYLPFGLDLKPEDGKINSELNTKDPTQGVNRDRLIEAFERADIKTMIRDLTASKIMSNTQAQRFAYKYKEKIITELKAFPEDSIINDTDLYKLTDRMGNIKTLTAKLLENEEWTSKRQKFSVPLTLKSLEKSGKVTRRFDRNGVTHYIIGRKTYFQDTENNWFKGIYKPQAENYGPLFGRSRGTRAPMTSLSELEKIFIGKKLAGGGMPESLVNNKFSDGNFVPAMVSNGEYLVNKDAVKHYGVSTMDAINSGKFADGGKIVGPGGPKDDVIPMNIPAGSYVINAAATKKATVGMLDAINNKKMSRGGLLGLAGGGDPEENLQSFKERVARRSYEQAQVAAEEHAANQEKLRVLQEQRRMAKEELRMAEQVHREIMNDSNATKEQRKAAKEEVRKANEAVAKSGVKQRLQDQKELTAKSEERMQLANENMQMQMAAAGLPMGAFDPNAPKEKKPLKERIRNRYKPGGGMFKSGMGSMIGGTALATVGSMASGAMEANSGGPTAASQALSMAGTGAMLGSMLGPEGLAVGAIGGAIVGGIMGKMEEDQRKLTNSINQSHEKNLGLISSMNASSDVIAQLGLNVKSISDIKLGSNAQEAEAYSNAINQVADAMANGSDATKSMINYIKTATATNQRKALGQQFSGVLAAGGTIEQATYTAGGAAKAAGLSGLMSSIAINQMKREAEKALASGKSLQLFGAEKQFANAQQMLNQNGGLNLNKLRNTGYSYNVAVPAGRTAVMKTMQGNLANTLGYSGQNLPEGFMLSSLRNIKGKSAEDIGAKGLGGAQALGSNDVNVAAVAKLAKVTENMNSGQVEQAINTYLKNLNKIPEGMFQNAQDLQDAYDQINSGFTKPMEDAIMNMKSSDFKQYIDQFTSKMGNASDVMKVVADKVAADLSPEMQALEGSLGNSTAALGRFLTAVNAISGLQFNSKEAQAAVAAAITDNPSLAGAAVNQVSFETSAANIGQRELGNINGSNTASQLQAKADKSAKDFAASQKAAQRAYQKEQEGIQDSIKAKNKYIDSIRKEMDARQKLYDKKQQGIEQDLTLRNLQNDIYKARTTGSLLDQAAAQSAYNAELNKQSDLKKKQAADEKDQSKIDKANEQIQKLQDALDALSKKYDKSQQAAQDSQDATQASYKKQIEDAKKLGDTTSAKQAAWQQGWMQITQIVEQGGKEIPNKLLDSISKASGVSKTQILKDFGTLVTDFNKTIGPNGVVINANGTMTKLGIPNGTIIVDASGNLTWKDAGGKPKWVDIGNNVVVSNGSKDVTTIGSGPLGNKPLPTRGVATGGRISGPGTGTSDSIPAMLSDGEYVVRADSVSHYGQGMMDAINTKKFASGGMVGPGIGEGTPKDPNGTGNPKAKPNSAPSVSGNAEGQKIANYAKQFVGVRYVDSATLPGGQGSANPKNGWDCSTFVTYVYKQFGMATTPYTWSQLADKKFKPVSHGHELPGDTLYYMRNGSHHVRIYLGNGSAIGAESPGVGTIITSAFSDGWSSSRYGVKSNKDGSRRRWEGATSNGPLTTDTTTGKKPALPKINFGFATPFAVGGNVTGPGGPKDDKIFAMLSNGEYVINADSVSKVGKPFLDMINSGNFDPKFSSPTSRISIPNAVSEPAGAVTNNVEYNLSVTVEKTNASAEDIANVVIQTLKRKEKTNRTHRNL